MANSGFRFQRSQAPVTIQNGGSVSDQRRCEPGHGAALAAGGLGIISDVLGIAADSMTIQEEGMGWDRSETEGNLGIASAAFGLASMLVWVRIPTYLAGIPWPQGQECRRLTLPRSRGPYSRSRRGASRSSNVAVTPIIRWARVGMKITILPCLRSQPSRREHRERTRADEWGIRSAYNPGPPTSGTTVEDELRRSLAAART